MQTLHLSQMHHLKRCLSVWSALHCVLKMSYDIVFFFSPTNSWKCSPEQHAGSQVSQLELWPHWHTYYCVFCCFFFISPLLRLFLFTKTGPVLQYLDTLWAGGIGGTIRLSTDFCSRFSQRCLNKETTDKWTQSVSPKLSLNVLNG